MGVLDQVQRIFMRSLPIGDDRPSYTVEEPGEDYYRLLGAARRAAKQIVKTSAEGLSGAASYIHRVSRELITAVSDSDEDALVGSGAIFECLDRLVQFWPDIAAGRVEGEQVLSGEPGLWKRAMTEWPMGGFARMTADFMMENDMLGGTVVELGAGVGSCSALVADQITGRFIRTDLQPFLLKRQKIVGTVERYDFDTPGHWRDLDTIFAVNALHCAKDKVATIRNLFEMLRTGGALVLGEGIPYTDERGTPWALNPFFGLFKGWWDIGGFMARVAWFAAFRQAGVANFGYAVRRAGSHDLGGVIWAVKS
jgi:SAM-dependent methyltransferase